MCRIRPIDAGGPNVCAFLDMLAVSEIGARMLAMTDDGYDVIVGSTPQHPSLMKSYADHPRQLVRLPALGIKSTAAGRYQFIERTWDGLAKSLGFAPRAMNFEPQSQDRACIELLRQIKAYPQIAGGNIEGAIRIANGTWASLPGAGFGQHENRMSDLVRIFMARFEHYRSPDFSNVQAGVESTAKAET